MLPAIAAARIGVDFAESDLRLPIFDASGHLLRRVTAASAFGPLDAPRLEQGRVDFFAADAETAPVATLLFDQAVYGRATEQLTGGGAITFTSGAGTLSGQGYECRPGAGWLTLQRQVKFASGDIVATGDQADVHFDPQGRKGEDMVRRVRLTGRVVVVPAAAAKVPFERVESTEARYEAGEQKIYVKTPVTVWKNGQRGVMELASGFWELSLSPLPAKSAESKAVLRNE
ncbi:MAG TPA: hypothetical protein VHE61_18650 [Opitutaceae bacterium]|nr:hypothetical protein [Opitutaceae bacterium]